MTVNDQNIRTGLIMGKIKRSTLHPRIGNRAHGNIVLRVIGVAQNPVYGGTKGIAINGYTIAFVLLDNIAHSIDLRIKHFGIGT